ncbi:MAG: F0F1 ATP synthase subunit B [Acidimicrobiia bacterium]|nr:MAG: F0F1 ATP synthase subunit B [Acidimicrobiia bacterium]
MLMHVFAQVILATEEVVPISEEPSSGGGASLLLPAPEELFAGIIAFSIVFFFIWKWAIPALNKALEARQQAIAAELESAEKAKIEAETLLADYRSQVAGAKDEAAQIVGDARDAGEVVKSDIVSRAEAEAEQIKARAHDEVVSERERVASDLRRQVADLSIDVAEKVVVSSIDAESQRALVDRYIDELGGVQ